MSDPFRIVYKQYVLTKPNEMDWYKMDWYNSTYGLFVLSLQLRQYI